MAVSRVEAIRDKSVDTFSRFLINILIVYDRPIAVSTVGAALEASRFSNSRSKQLNETVDKSMYHLTSHLNTNTLVY